MTPHYFSNLLLIIKPIILLRSDKFNLFDRRIELVEYFCGIYCRWIVFWRTHIAIVGKFNLYDTAIYDHEIRFNAGPRIADRRVVNFRSSHFK